MPETSYFNGSDYQPQLDFNRLNGQMNRIRNLMLDGQWRTLSEIQAITGDPAASVSAQLRHLRKPRFGSHLVTKRRRGEPSIGLFEYRVQAA
jgi:hypothetical protein